MKIVSVIDGSTLYKADAQNWKELIEKAVEADANLQDANLQDANLQDANLQGAKLQDANLQDANLQGAKLQGANLQEANLQGTKLQGANLQGANLQGTNLQGTKLQGANLQGANLDYSSWPMHCGSLNAKIDGRIFRQLLFHAARAGKEIEDPAIKRLLKLKSFRDVCAKFHRFEECGGFEGRKS